jgi:hypothetical protein
VVQGCAQNIGMFVAAGIIFGMATEILGVGARAYFAKAVSIQWRPLVLGLFPRFV